jgi:AraC-type DNA-binding domain-containing proteins
VTGAITALDPDAPPYAFQKFSGIQNHQQPDFYENMEMKNLETPNFDIATQHYVLENEFLSRIAEGQSELALEAWHRLGKIPRANELFLDGLRGLTTNASILRTLIRKEAERSGVHPAIVDAISLAYAQKMYAARSAEELQQLMPDMIREFSQAVNDSHVSRYSPPIARVSAYLHLHVSNQPDMKQLAELAKCSANHLGRRFKEETGLTIAQYLAKERCAKAAALLVHTDLPIHAVSAHVGYLDNNYFVKVFKKYMQDTPTAYRRKFHG